MPIVIKYGGNAMTDPQVKQGVAREIRALHDEAQQPIVVHGGGPFIQEALDKAGLEHHFVRGLRVTTAASLPVIEATLTLVNKQLSQEIGHALGLTGRDSSVLKAEQFDESLGFVGRMTSINQQLLEALLAANIVPVLACLAENEAGDNILNVNADEVAAAVAGAMKIPVVFLTNVSGVLDDPKNPETLLTAVTRADINLRIADGRIAGGMIPKVEAALSTLDRGARYAIIADGRDAHTLRRAITGEAGTRVLP